MLGAKYIINISFRGTIFYGLESEKLVKIWNKHYGVLQNHPHNFIILTFTLHDHNNEKLRNISTNIPIVLCGKGTPKVATNLTNRP